MYRSLLILLSLIFSQALFGIERIDKYDVFVELQKDSSFIVEETIHYNFGRHRKHGIFRKIPSLIKRATDTKFGVITENYKVNIDIDSVTDENEKDRPFSTSYVGSDLKIKIGSANKFVTGEQIYIITYKVTRAINYFSDHDEFYWNIIGTKWPVHIRDISASIVLPREDENVKAKSFLGTYGAGTQHQGQLKNDTYLIQAEKLYPGQGLSTVISLPKGMLTPPALIKRSYWFLRDNIVILASLFLPILCFLFFFFHHQKYGKDPRSDSSVKVEYSPPADLSPAELGTLVDEKAGLDDLISTVFYLASQGFITIKVLETPKFLFFTSKDFLFTKTDKSQDSLSPYHKTFLDSFFGIYPAIKSSDLRNRFYTYIPKLKRQLYSELVLKRFFDKSPGSVRNRYLSISVTIYMVVFVLLFVVGGMSHQPDQLLWLFPSSAITVVIIIIYSRLMPCKTLKGVETLKHIEGFKEFIKTVEAPKLKAMLDQNPEIFGDILPYALVLGLADEWANKFQDILKEAPSWFESKHYFRSGQFRPRSFMNDMGSNMSSLSNSFQSTPSRSGSGGSSGFSSGGGFSGGGFGGGGGGSW